MKLLLSGLFLGCVALLACSSGDDDDDNGSSGSSNSSSGGGGGSSSGGAKAECSSEKDCAKLTCVCGGLSGAEVQRCSNGVCAKSCEEAGCK